MAIRFSTGLLNQFAPYITELTELSVFNFPELLEYRSSFQAWMPSYILQSSFGHKYPAPFHKWTIAFLRKTGYAFKHYFISRDALSLFVNTPILFSEDTPKQLSSYFESLHNLEVSISLIYQAYCVFGKIIADGKFWNKGDGSTLERINLIYNNIKHAEDRIDKALLEPGSHIWLTNSSICCEQGPISYKEISESLIDLADNASYYCNPGKVFEDLMK
ncbi:MAG: hypothetical protein WAV07_14240 [Candidatus Contendobacter sp.]